MVQTPRPAALSSHLRLALSVLLFVAALVGIAMLALEVARRIDAQSGSTTDNMQWTLSQLEMELLNLELALDDAAHDPDALGVARTKFDIFFSRVGTLQEGSVFAALRQDKSFAEGLAQLESFVTRTARLMDGAEPDLIQALPEVRSAARALLPVARGLALNGVEQFAGISDTERAEVKHTLMELALLTLTLVAGLAVMLWRVGRLAQAMRLRAEEKEQALSRLDAVVTTALDAVITLNDHGLIVDFNPAAEQIFGHARAEAVGRPLTLIIPLDDHGRSQLPPRHQMLNAGQRRRRVTARHKNGHDFPAEVSLSSALSGPARVHVVYLRDLSQQVAAEQALVTARDEALAGEKAKAYLLVVMSHEIRTPLNGMIGTIELLEGTQLQPHQREYLRILAASGRLLMHHVNDVLDIARLDSGKASLNLAPVNLADLVREVIENQTPASLANGNVLEFVPPRDGRVLVLSDAAMLRQVLLNLVGNAVKFTQRGTVTVEVAHLTARGPTEIIVRDTGVGIPREDLGRVFEDFVTLDASYARKSAGTGLGLGIVRRVVTRLGGKIGVESAPGEGSTFRVTLPLTFLESVRPVSPEAPARLPAAEGMSVLVVEDNDFNRIIVRDMLLGANHSVTEAHDGMEGVRLAEARKFDVILMDISMPGIDGVQATRTIREGQGASARSPIVALTAHALREDTERFLAAGMQDVLFKPVTQEGLRSLLARIKSGAATAAPPPSVSDAETIAPDVGDPLVDMSVLSSLRTSLGAAKAGTLLEKFILDTETHMADLVCRGEDPTAEAELLGAVHRLRGTAAMFGAARLHGCLSEMEDHCKRGNKTAARARVPDAALIWRDTAAAYREVTSLPQASSLR